MTYYPLIRGRQFDLLALSNLVTTGALSSQIVPVIEPVKDSPALAALGAAFARANHPLFVIQNPQVGSYGLLEAPQHVITLGKNVQAARYFDAVSAPLILAQTPAQLAALPRHQRMLVPAEARFRALRRPKAIYLSEAFPTRAQTADYALLPRELYQYPRGQAALLPFGDYPFAQRAYDERGHPQKALALHLLAPGEAGGLWWHHFTSRSNDGYANPQQKFFEAVAPVADWVAVDSARKTPAIVELIALGQRAHFPGLGTLRRLQLEHFFTVIGRWLAAER